MFFEKCWCVQAECEDEIDGFEQDRVLCIRSVARFSASTLPYPAMLGSHEDFAQDIVQ